MCHLDSWFTDYPGILIPKWWANPYSRWCRSYQSWELQYYRRFIYSHSSQEITTARARFPKPAREYEIVSIYGPSIVSCEGEEWKKYRKISAPAFSHVRIDVRLVPLLLWLKIPLFFFAREITNLSGMRLLKSWMSFSMMFGQEKM